RGSASDDYVGRVPTLDLGYVYNADDFDGYMQPEPRGYGAPPPAAGYAILRGPVAGGAPLGMTSFMSFISGGPAGNEDPRIAPEYYNVMQGRWRGGQPVTARDLGFNTDGAVTTFMYPADPATGAFWSEVNTDGRGSSNTPGDRRFTMGSGPFAMQPGE